MVEEKTGVLEWGCQQDEKKSGGELVPYAPYGVKVLGHTWVHLEVLPESHDEIVHRARSGKDIVSPDLLEDLLPRYHLPGLFHKQPQEHGFPLAQGSLLPVPVSYTHLRAHETVLDLVCRLLLEKKKHQ